jgi:chromosome partitioning protein
MVGKIISIANQKGGVGKTTTAINLSSSLAVHCKSTLLIDLDPQSNATSGLGLDKKESENGLYQVIIDGQSAEQAVRPTAVEWLDIIPSTTDLIGAEVELINVAERERVLGKAIEGLRNSYDYIFIDCPPSLGLLTVNALTCSDSILIPIQCEYYAMEGLTQLLKTIHLLRQQLNTDLELEGVLLTMFDSRLNLSGQVVGEVRKFFGPKTYQTVVRRNVRLAEAPSYGKPVILHDRSSAGAQEYLSLAKEFIERQS